MADKLQVYNGALLHLGAKTLATLTEERKSRRVLDTIWAAGAVRYCLQQGYWNFATRTIKIDATPSVEPNDFGYRYAFPQPSDFVRMLSISYGEYMDIPLNRFVDEAHYWFADYDKLYISYISDDVSYGGSLGDWSESFTRFVELYLAQRAAPSITHDSTIVAKIEKLYKDALSTAKTKDATNQGAKETPLGALASARLNGRRSGTRSSGGWLM
jgi:hypothetical protein